MTLVETPRIILATVTSDGAALAGRHTPVDATSGNRTMTLPSSATPGAHLSVEKVDASSNTVTVSGTIRGGSSTLVLTLRYQSVTFTADPTGTSWTPTAGHITAASLAATTVTLWKANTAYTAGQAVLNPSGQVVTALVNFTAGSSYDATKWSAPTASGGALNDRGAWTSSTTYAVGDVVLVSGVRYACKTANTSSSAFSTDSAKWVQVGIDSSGAATIDTTATDIAPLGARAAGATGHAADAGHVHPLPNAVSGDITLYTVDGTPVIFRVVNGIVGGGTGGTAPSQVGTVTHTPGNAQVALSWSAPTAGTQAITDYVIQYKLSSSGTWLTFSDGVSTATTATVTGLTNGSAYDFRVAAVSSVGTGTYSATVSDTPAAVTLFTDTFTRADGAIGNGWTTTSPGLGIASNKLVSLGGAYSGQMAYRDLGVSDGHIKITVALDGQGSGPFLVFRYSDASNYWYISGDRHLYKVVAGASSQPLGHGFYNAQGTDPYDIDVVLTGASIEVYYAGNEALGGPLTDSFNQTATKFGVMMDYPSTGQTVSLFQQVS